MLKIVIFPFFFFLINLRNVLGKSENYIIRMKSEFPLISHDSLDQMNSRKQRIYNLLSQHTVATQEGVISFLRQDKHILYQQFWIDNSILIYKPTKELIHKLSKRDDIESIRRDGEVKLDVDIPHVKTPISSTKSISAQSNIKALLADKLWSNGVLGKGIVIANIDSGVRYSHEALRYSYRGYISRNSYDHNYSFMIYEDNITLTPDTSDPMGHGTHCMGTAAGSLGIGIAPNATWITARAFNWNGTALQSNLLHAAQWIICPTNFKKLNPNCSLGADIVSNSFGGRNSLHWFDRVIHSWKLAGILPIFASGNTNGFLCKSVLYPACSNQVLAIGATIGKTTLWGASGKGPSLEGNIKPDFVCPGVGIRSALSTHDTKYMRLTGTSMATPHIAGALALLLSIKTNESHKKIIQLLKDTANRDLLKPILVPSKCGNTSYKIYPNNIYGWGIPNLCEAAHALNANICRPNTFLLSSYKKQQQYEVVE